LSAVNEENNNESYSGQLVPSWDLNRALPEMDSEITSMREISVKIM
jgi:hypothetical protein